MVNLDQLTISGAVVHPEVNGLWVEQDETNGGKVVFKHSTASLFLHADTRSHGNWHIGSVIEGGDVFYWSYRSSTIPLQKGKFFIASTSPPEQSQLFITFDEYAPIFMVDGECDGKWSSYLSNDNGLNPPGGDIELRCAVMANPLYINSVSVGLCDPEYIVAAEARHKDGPNAGSHHELQVVTLTTNNGLTCYDADQPNGETCNDYEVRYCCRGKVATHGT